MALSAHEMAQLRDALQDAVVRCSERCLYQAAKWAAELLTSLPDTPDDEDEEEEREQEDIDVESQSHLSPVFLPNQDPEEARLESRELSRYLLAKSLFDCREYDRCAAVFLPDSLFSAVLGSRPHASPTKTKSKSGGSGARAKRKSTEAAAGSRSSSSSLPRISQKSLFLALYAKFLSGEKRKAEDSEMVTGPQDIGTVVNKQLLAVGSYLSSWFEARTVDGEVVGSQGWLEYLYGIVLAKEKNDKRALGFFLQSVHKFPMNWGCWLEITSLTSRVEDLDRISRHCPQNIMSYMFHLHTSLELYQHSATLGNSLEQLAAIFPTSSFLLTCNALLAYHEKDLMLAEQRFSRLLALHPHRLDSLDHYSNILYVLELRPKLAFLAHLCSNVDKFRPESCVVIGNYYSLLSMHDKAVQYFRRALTLDRTCLSAWTLMGHEYVELKNTHAAIESYRRAVDVNRRDYRAWYGLGQTYEMLEMHTYSLWYYKKAAGLRPWDGKMWMAVGSCLQKMGRERDGIKALKRALLADAYYDAGSSFGGSGGSGAAAAAAAAGSAAAPMGHMDPEILLQIATMYENLGEEEEAKSYMELCVGQEDGGGGGGGGDGPAGRDADTTVLDSTMSTTTTTTTTTTTVPHGTNDSFIGADSDNDGSDGDEERQGSGTGTGTGTGVTAATSKARMWLARFAMRTADYSVAHRLATELCQDGVEVEEAKALVREVRSRLEASEGIMFS